MRLTPVLPLFSVAFAVAYAVAVEYNLAAFTYHPQLGAFALGVDRPKAGPAMYWYGWIVTSVLAAALVSALAMLLPRQWMSRLWTGFVWLVPSATMLFFVYILRGYFLR